MPSLLDLPEPSGCFTHARRVDGPSSGALPAPRGHIERELRGQLGRSRAELRFRHSSEPFAPGRLWEDEIKAAIEQSVVFVPILTPFFVKSAHCRFELEAFLARGAALGRNDLIFPILYSPPP